MKLKELIDVMDEDQEILIFSGYVVKFVGMVKEFHMKTIFGDTVKKLEKNGEAITIKLNNI
ncbi:hypothetical protein SAMN05216249_103110 [Acetitomaculum ruminis DSM 5522]|uniref:Uncharacterized protein n=1 Tax=Acetitomaculum ruminis DSM 5522 TaxID=1120918 RepID=A0A1I0W613_9FIRM|nr:hypothetical protein [Acetitomaculum ruminis]SFA84112.1 hypothetical protein SAMN05216249_103110 [Acetitomaculum ruminis DSM 5522]